MTKVFLLGANREIDTDVQTVSVNQVIQTEGWQYDKYVVCEINKDQWGVHYKLINLQTKDFQTADMIRPLSQKFGIGYYYDSENPQFMDGFEVAILLQEATAKAKAEQDEAEKERIRVEEVKATGRVRFAEIFPEDALGVIVAYLRQNDSDSQRDYFAYTIQRAVILGFSTHKRDIFSEMRKHASNFDETAHLAEYNENYEHRKKYSMGDGYYLGESKYHGWTIEKVPVHKRENTIEEFAYTAGSPDGVQIKPCNIQKADRGTNTNSNEAEQQSAAIQIQSDNLQFEIVDYSEKAIALFGDTKEIKDTLRDLRGRFNPRLSYNGSKKAGWIFSKVKREELERVLNIK